MTEIIRYSRIFIEDLERGYDSKEVTLADGNVVSLRQVNLDDISGVFATNGTVERNLSTWLSDWYNVRAWIDTAVDGTTSNQTGIALAVAQAYADGKELYWPVGTYVITASIANFHSVRHHGPGLVKRGSTSFYVEPMTGQSNTLYVATTGSDTNDGLTSALPFLTVQQAFDVLQHYAPLRGGWTVSIAAGTYAAGAVLADGIAAGVDTYLTIAGPSQASVQTVPTAIIDYPGSGLIAWDIGRYNKVKVMDVKFTDWMSPALTGLNVNEHSFCWAYNVHTYMCRQGIVADKLSVLLVQGGIHEGCTWTGLGAFPTAASSAIIVYAGAVCSLGYNATSLATGTIMKCYVQAAVELKSHTHTVMEYCTLQSNEKAVWIYGNARLDERNYNDFKKNKLAIFCQHGFLATGIYAGIPSNYHIGETYSQPPDGVGDGNYENFRFIQFGNEDSTFHYNGITGVDMGYFHGTTLQTGTIASTLTRNICTIYAGTFGVGQSRYFEVWLCGRTTGTAGGKTVLLKKASNTLATLLIPSGTVDWSAHITVWAHSNTQCTVIVDCTDGCQSSAMRASPTHDYTVDETIDVWTAIPGASDTATLYESREIHWGF